MSSFKTSSQGLPATVCAAGLTAADLDVVHFCQPFCHLQVLPDNICTLSCCLSQLRIGGGFSFCLKFVQVFLMILHHRLNVGLVEGIAGKRLQLCCFCLIACACSGRRRYAESLRDRLHLLVKLGMVCHHPLPELSNVICTAFLLGHLAELDFGIAALGSFLYKGLVR